MSLSTTLFGGGGGFGADNPEYRNEAEWTATLQRISLLAQENPQALQQYFSTRSGQQELQRLGFNDIDQLMSYAQSSAPNVAGSHAYGQLGADYGNSLDSIMQGMQGQNGDLNDYGSDFNYTSQDISNIPDEVYNQLQQGQEEQAARGFKGALQSLGQQYGERGFRPGTSGFEQGAGSSLGRGYLEQLRNISRDIGMQKAGSKLDTAKFMSTQNLQRQGMQDASSQARAKYLSDLQMYAKNFGSSNLQQQAALANQKFIGQGASYDAQNQAALAPYNMGQEYYTTTMNNQGPEKKKGIFGDVLNAGASVAGALL